MTTDKPADVVDLRGRRGYRPDVESLACARVAAARKQTGLPVAAFAAALEPLLGWLPTPGVVQTWESVVPAPGEVVIACEVLASRMARTGSEDDADEVASAAREAEAEQSWLLGEPGQQSVDALWDGALEIARAANRSALDMFNASRRIRRDALQLAKQAHRPGTLSDLYVIAGQATALMASTVFDLGRWDESATLARSAVSYAALVGNASLQAWTLGLAALLANWRNEPDTALRHFRQGMEVAPAGIPTARLRYIAARSYALLGDAPSVARVLDQARQDQDGAGQHRDLLCEDTGGEFAFGRGRAEACAAAAWLDLGQGPEAKEAAQRALGDLVALPPGRQPLSQVTGARIDLATACLILGELDEAEAILDHVFAIPSSLSNVSLSGRLKRAREHLASPCWSGDPAVRRLSDALGDWPARQR
jgi:tetratricopeptide (TPR) repeat protein